MNDMWSTIDNAIYSAGNILGTRYAVPQLAAGQYYATTPQGGVVTYQNPAGSSMFSMPSGSSSLLLYGGLALVVVLLLSRGH
jgi:hypothetical protein